MAQPTVSGGSSAENIMVEIEAAEVQAAGPQPVGADAGADAEAPLMVPDAAESDNEAEGPDDVPAPKFRKLSCSEPPPSVRVRDGAAVVGGWFGWWSGGSACLLVPSAIPCLFLHARSLPRVCPLQNPFACYQTA